MLRFMLISLVMLYNFSAMAQESSEGNNSAETETSASEESAEENGLNKPTVAQIPELDCTGAFIERVKAMPAKEQNKLRDDYFAVTSNFDYQNDKSDEFAWKEKEKSYQAQFEGALKEKTVYEVYTQVKLGKYDFKKKGFPVEVKVDPKGELSSFFSSSGGMGGLGGPKLGGFQICMGNSKEAPKVISINVANAKKLNFISVSEETAKNITPELGKDRLAFTTYLVEVKKINTAIYDPLRLKVKDIKYDIVAHATKAKLTVGTQQVGEVELK